MSAVIPAAPGWIVIDGERVRPVVGWSAGEPVNGPVIYDADTRRVGVAERGDVAFSLSAYQGALRETGV